MPDSSEDIAVRCRKRNVFIGHRYSTNHKVLWPACPKNSAATAQRHSQNGYDCNPCFLSAHEVWRSTTCSRGSKFTSLWVVFPHLIILSKSTYAILSGVLHVVVGKCSTSVSFRSFHPIWRKLLIDAVRVTACSICILALIPNPPIIAGFERKVCRLTHRVGFVFIASIWSFLPGDILRTLSRANIIRSTLVWETDCIWRVALPRHNILPFEPHTHKSLLWAISLFRCDIIIMKWYELVPRRFYLSPWYMHDDISIIATVPQAHSSWPTRILRRSVVAMRLKRTRHPDMDM